MEPARKTRVLERRRPAAGLPRDGSLADRVYRLLKKDIITGHFQPGQALSENRLAALYATSRTPVRDAAARLLREKLLRSVANKGYFLHPFSLLELKELYEFRTVIEAACAQMAAEKVPEPGLLKELRELAAVGYQAGNRSSYVRFIEADTAFHVGIARLTRNRRLVDAVSDIRSQIERLLYSTIEVGNYGAVLAGEHRSILQAIQSRDPQAARERMLEHVLGSKRKVLESL